MNRVHIMLACAALAVWAILTPRVLAHGDLHEQIAALSRVLRRSPSAELFHKRGELYRAHGDYLAALRDYARAEKLAPALSVVRLSRGRTLLESGELVQACDVLEKYLREQPTHAEARLLLARGYKQRERRAEAETQYARALQLIAEPSPDLVLERAQNLDAAGEPDAALRVIEAGIAQLGPLITLQDSALRIECEQRRWDAALVRLEGMLVGVPRPETLLARKAELLELAGRPEAARAVRLDALASIERLPETKRQLGNTRKLEQRLRAASDATGTASTH